MKQRLGQIAAAAGMLLMAGGAMAQDKYPVDTVTMVVPYATGGAGDIVGRLVADELSQRLGVTFIVENLGGASGTLGAEKAARSPADGSTLLLAGNAIFTTAPHLAEVPFDPITDFTAIANVSEAVRLLAASKTIPVANFEEFVAYAKANPGALNYGSVGVGSTGHVATVDLLRVLEIEATHVPYKGAAEVVQAMLSGDIQFMLDAAAVAQAKQDAVTPLAVPGAIPMAALPDVPTYADLGVTSITGTGWQMVMGPANMPPEVVAMVEGALKAASEDPAFLDKLGKAGVSPRFIPGAELSAALQDDFTRQGELLTEIGVKK
jgi:tripartite-type tricarboxylate transporter receptor subunit TctC